MDHYRCSRLAYNIALGTMLHLPTQTRGSKGTFTNASQRRVSVQYLLLCEIRRNLPGSPVTRLRDSKLDASCDFIVNHALSHDKSLHYPLGCARYPIAKQSCESSVSERVPPLRVAADQECFGMTDFGG